MYKTLLALAGFLLASVAVASQPPEDGGDYDLISDPAELAARGFAPDGPPLWRLKPVDDPQELAARRAERQAEAERDGSPEFGGPAVRSASVQSTDFRFLNEASTYNTSGTFTLACTAGSPNRFADAPIYLKNDRRLTWLDVWTSDTSTDDGVNVALYRSCQPGFAGGAPVVTELGLINGGTFSAGNRFNDLFMSPVHVQNSTCAYWVRTMFDNCAAGTSVRVQKVRVMWSQG